LIHFYKRHSLYRSRAHTAKMKLMYLLVMVMMYLVTKITGVPVYRGQDGHTNVVTEKPQTGGHTFSYLSDIADMETIRRQRTGKVVNFLEQKEPSISPITPSSVLGFMKQFGYLAQGAPNTEALHTEAAITDAVMQMQIYGGLHPSGIINEETLKLLSKPRCGNKDGTDVRSNAYRRRSKRFVIGAKGWKKRTLTYNLSNWTPKLGSKDFVASELDKAFQSWAHYANLKFKSTDDYYKADIKIAFGRYSHGDYYPFDGPGLILAHAYYPYEFGDFGGDIHFDEDEDWRANVTDLWSGMDFFTVAQHEIGHSLGLSHSPVADSVMYPYYKGKQGNQGVGYDDVLAMYELYIRNQPSLPDEADEDYEVGNESPDDVDDDQSDYAADEGDYYNDSPQDDDEKRTSSTTTTTSTSTVKPFTTTKAPDADSTTQTYVGDYEDVDDHIKREKDKEKEKDICSGTFDTIGHIRSELFVFLGEQMWRFSGRGSLRPGYPAPASQMFGFPKGIENIDAVYERNHDGNILFFTGHSYWISDGNSFIDNSPRPLTDLGLPRSLSKIDAIFIWGKNQKTYIFAGNQYWR